MGLIVGGPYPGHTRVVRFPEEGAPSKFEDKVHPHFSQPAWRIRAVECQWFISFSAQSVLGVGGGLGVCS